MKTFISEMYKWSKGKRIEQLEIKQEYSLRISIKWNWSKGINWEEIFEWCSVRKVINSQSIDLSGGIS